MTSLESINKDDPKHAAAVVFGGRSPIAIACAQAISSTQTVFLVTRAIDDKLRYDLSQFPNIYLIEANLEISKSAKAVITQIYESGFEIESVAFFQRYRPKDEPDFVSHCAVELWSINDSVEQIVSLKKPSTCVQIAISSSPAAHRVVIDQDLHYHIVKSGQEALVRYITLKYGMRNIRINAVRVGSLVIKERAADYWNSIPGVVTNLQSLSAIGEISTSDDIGNFFANLLMSPLQSMSGQVINIDSGFHLMDASQIAKKVLENHLYP